MVHMQHLQLFPSPADSNLGIISPARTSTHPCCGRAFVRVRPRSPDLTWSPDLALQACRRLPVSWQVPAMAWKKQSCTYCMADVRKTSSLPESFLLRPDLALQACRRLPVSWQAPAMAWKKQSCTYCTAKAVLYKGAQPRRGPGSSPPRLLLQPKQALPTSTARGTPIQISVSCFTVSNAAAAQLPCERRSDFQEDVPLTFREEAEPHVIRPHRTLSGCRCGERSPAGWW